MEEDPLERWYTVVEIANAMSVNPQTVRRAIHASEFPGAINLGGTGGWRIPASALRAWMARKQAETLVRDSGKFQ